MRARCMLCFKISVRKLDASQYFSPRTKCAFIKGLDMIKNVSFSNLTWLFDPLSVWQEDERPAFSAEDEMKMPRILFVTRWLGAEPAGMS